MTKLVIIGGGVIGCSIALKAAEMFDEVLILDRSGLGSGTSSDAIGGIGPNQTDGFVDAGPISLAVRSQRMYRRWMEDVEERSGMAVPVLRSGMLEVAFDEQELSDLVAGPAEDWRSAGFDVRNVSAEEIHEMEPDLTRSIVGGVFLPNEDCLEARTLMAALATAAERNARISVRVGDDVRDVTSTSRAVSVSLANGDIVSGDMCVAAAGAWSSSFLPFPPGATFPHKGQVVEYEVPGQTGYAMRHHVYGKPKFDGVPLTAYFAPRSDGRVTTGVTYEKGIWDRDPDEEGKAKLIKAASAVHTRASEWIVKRHWGCIRPGTLDGYPIIGAIDEHSRLFAATGHYGAGMTLAPITAVLVAALMSGEPLSEEHAEDLRRCSPHRFRATE